MIILTDCLPIREFPKSCSITSTKFLKAKHNEPIKTEYASSNTASSLFSTLR